MRLSGAMHCSARRAKLLLPAAYRDGLVPDGGSVLACVLCRACAARQALADVRAQRV